jgi:uncharacterized protein
MKKLISTLFILAAIFFVKPAMAQTTSPEFTGAQATLQHYKAIYFIDDADPKKIQMILRNIDNALEDERLNGKVEIELVAFGPGVDMYKKVNPYEEQLLALQKKGVILAECSNTIKLMHIDKDTLFPFISYVPSGNGEIIIRGQQGWTVVHP